MKKNYKGKNIKKAKPITDRSFDDELLPEYEIDYTKVKRNPFYKKTEL